MAHGFSQEELNTMETAFSLFDDRGDKTIRLGDLHRVLASLGHEPEEIPSDLDLNSRIDFDTFLHLMNPGEDHSQVRKAFGAFDCHNRGYVSAEEFRRILMDSDSPNRFTSKEVEEVLAHARVGKDGKFFYDQLIHDIERGYHVPL